MADNENALDVEPMIAALAKANHNYFVRRQQTRYAWEQLMPKVQSYAIEAHREIFMDGPADLFLATVNDALAAAPVLNMRLELFIAELRGRADIANTAKIADELEAIITRPMEG